MASLTARPTAAQVSTEVRCPGLACLQSRFPLRPLELSFGMMSMTKVSQLGCPPGLDLRLTSQANRDK